MKAVKYSILGLMKEDLETGRKLMYSMTATYDNEGLERIQNAKRIVKSQKEYLIYLRQKLNDTVNVNQSTVSKCMKSLGVKISGTGYLIRSATWEFDEGKNKLGELMLYNRFQIHQSGDTTLVLKIIDEHTNIRTVLKKYFSDIILSLFTDEFNNLVLLFEDSDQLQSFIHMAETEKEKLSDHGIRKRLVRRSDASEK